MNSKSGTATTTAQGLPSWVIDGRHPQGLLNRAWKLYDQFKDGNVYSGQTYADQTQEEIDGIARLAARGRNGDSTIDVVVGDAEAILNDDYLDGNTPDFVYITDLTMQNATNMYGSQITPNLGGKLYCVGDLSNDNLADALDDTTVYDDILSARLYVRNRSNERSIQDSVVSIAVELGRQAIVDADALRMAGLYQREYDQGKLEDNYKIWYDGEVSKVRYLEVLGNAIRGLVGTQVATTRPYYRPSPMVGMMGGAMSGAATGTMVMPGIGTAIGGFAGALLGLAA